MGRGQARQVWARPGDMDGAKPTSGDAYVAGFSLAGLFDCKRAEAQV